MGRDGELVCGLMFANKINSNHILNGRDSHGSTVDTYTGIAVDNVISYTNDTKVNYREPSSSFVYSFSMYNIIRCTYNKNSYFSWGGSKYTLFTIYTTPDAIKETRTYAESGSSPGYSNNFKVEIYVNQEADANIVDRLQRALADLISSNTANIPKSAY